MEPQAIRLPTVSEYAAAFRRIEDRVTDNQRKMLEIHHASSAGVISSTQLAHGVDFSNYRGANLQYGLLADMVCHELSMELPAGYARVGILVRFVPPNTVSNADWLWVMRPNVALALEAVGWVPVVSPFLYADEAVQDFGSD